MLSKFAGSAIATLIAVYGLTAADVAVIVNSGSTNKAGFRIVVERSGKAEFTVGPRRSGRSPDDTPKPVERTLPGTVVKRFYADLDAAKPLSSLPNRRCMKSASFGTKLTIEFDGEETPDLSCGSGDNAKLQDLVRDASEIVKLFNAN
jgi:hypothetical protein